MSLTIASLGYPRLSLSPFWRARMTDTDSAGAAIRSRTSCRICDGFESLNLLRRPDNGARCMSKPKKTPLQLETMIKAGISESMLWPKNAVVSIWPDADSWKAVCHSPNPVQDKECIERVRAEADRLKLKFDLDL
jgi:hypothetical protein